MPARSLTVQDCHPHPTASPSTLRVDPRPKLPVMWANWKKRASAFLSTRFSSGRWYRLPLRKIARREFGAATSLLEKLISLVNSMAALLEIPPCQLELPAEKLDAAEPALDQIATLRHIIAFAQAMEPAIAATGAALPSAIHRPIGDHIDRIVQVIQSGVALREITPNAR